MYIIVIIVINAQSPIDNFIDMGRTARNIVRSEILFGNHRPLAKATIAHRKEAGISLTIPLKRIMICSTYQKLKKTPLPFYQCWWMQARQLKQLF